MNPLAKIIRLVVTQLSDCGWEAALYSQHRGTPESRSQQPLNHHLSTEILLASSLIFNLGFWRIIIFKTARGRLTGYRYSWEAFYESLNWLLFTWQQQINASREQWHLCRVWPEPIYMRPASLFWPMYYGRNILSITWCQPRGLTLDTSTKRRPDLLQVPAAALPSGNVDSNTTIGEVSLPFNAH